MALLISTLGRKAPDLYAFTSHTFTEAGATGANGPTLTQIRTAYSSQAWAANTSFLSMATQGIQLWTVPSTRTYTIEAQGARGGIATSYTANSCFGGTGATIRVTMSLTAGQVLRLVVGQQSPSTGAGAGGGGGSWVIDNVTGNLLLVAGGGGGCGHDAGWGAGGSISNDQNGSSGGHGCAPTVTIGYGGGAGPTGQDGTYGYGGAGGGGVGWFGNGGTAGSGSGGTQFIGGGGAGAGGFGGGGGAGGTGVGGGGGGGYTGGGGGADYETGGNTFGPVAGTSSMWGGGGGGGSYYIPSATLVSATAGTNGNAAGTASSPGYITITVL